MIVLSPAEVMSLYLYGSKSAVGVDKLDHSIVNGPGNNDIKVDVNDYMDYGPGRFITAKDFDYVRNFFDSSPTVNGFPHPSLPPGVYTDVEVREFYYGRASITRYQSALKDGIDDLEARMFVWQSVGFEIKDDARFIVREDGTKYIENFKVIPYTAPGHPENFDFTGGKANLPSELFDPHGFGETVTISFSTDRTASTISAADFATLEQSSASLGLHNYEFFKDLAKELFDSGITKFIHDGKAIVYGNKDGGAVDVVGSINEFHRDAADNGLVFVGSNSSDVVGSSRSDFGSFRGDDVFFGNDGRDTLYGGGGDDKFYGGSRTQQDDNESDTLSGGGGFDSYFVGDGDVIIDSNGSGRINFDGIWLTGPKERKEGSSESELTYIGSNGETYKFVGVDLVVSLPGSGKIIVENFTIGDFGWTLGEESGDQPPDDGRDEGGGGDNSGDLPPDAAFHKPPFSPLVIDLDGDGIELTSLDGSNAFFDLNIDGFAERTGWVQSDDGLLALDLNGNGWIDDNTELFGNMTGFNDGFSALAEWDSNSDGVIDTLDTRFIDLKIWRDYDQDGVSDAGELTSLNETGILSIDLNADEVDETNTEHLVSHRSTITFADGSTGLVEDIHFQNDQSSSIALLPEGFEYNAEALIMPVLWGYGHITSTWVSLSVDTDLRTQARGLLDMLADGDIAGFKQAFEGFALSWAGVADVDSSSRGPTIDARHLAFLEKAFGAAFFMNDNHYNGDPGPVASIALEHQFDTLVEKLAARFMAQSAMADASLNADSLVDFFTQLADHPLVALAGLTTDYSPDNRNLSSDSFEWVNGFVAQIFDPSSGLTHDNAMLALNILSADIFDSAGLRTAIENAYVNAGGDAASAETFADGVFASSQLYVNDTSGNDTIVGDSGDNVLVGRVGSDTYLWGSGMGNDVIDEEGNGGGFFTPKDTDTDRLVLTNLNLSDIRFVKMEGDGFTSDFKIEVIATGEWLLLDDQLSKSAHENIEEIEFADGTVLSKEQFVALAKYWKIGDDGDNRLESAKADAVFIGNGGDDTMAGSANSDLYVYSQGDGNDLIIDESSAGKDILKLTDLLAADVTVTKSPTNPLDVIVTVVATGEVITLAAAFTLDDRGVDRIEFSDGSTLDIASLVLHEQKSTGTVTGTADANTYFHAEGDGTYRINDLSYSAANDRLVFSDVNADDVTFSINTGLDLVIQLANGETITMTDHFDGTQYTGNAASTSRAMELIQFADGTVMDVQAIRTKVLADIAFLATSGNDTIAGTHFADIINGGLGNDTMNGGAGMDTFVFNTALGTNNIDQIITFVALDDTIRLDSQIFAGLSLGTLSANSFVANTSGLSANVTERIIYETDTGRLLFDADGAGGADGIQFATLSIGLTLTQSDFFVF